MACDNPNDTYVLLENANAKSLETAAFADIANQLVTMRRVF